MDTGRQARRTPAVDVFEQWKESVVYVTGPMAQGKKVKLGEFFVLPDNGEKTESVGTGFVIHKSGYIVANAHAVEKIFDHRVVLHDDKSYPAELVAVVHHQDLALLKIEPKSPLKAVKLAASNDVMVGETVIVIGNPHGLLYTCTSGILSAVGRATTPDGLPGVTLQGMLQTDASINPGSSGGPWFNVLGEVMGVTASKRTDSDNIGFAVPVVTLRTLLPRMLDVERRYGFATGLTLSTDRPCEVLEVAPNSPAAAAGIRPGDFIESVDDRPVASGAELHLSLVGRTAGEELGLLLQHEGQPIRTSIVLAERPKPDAAALLKERLGMAAKPLDKETSDRMQLRTHRGVVVTEVEPGRYEEVKNPPKPGDVLARIGHIRPRDLKHLGELLDRMPRDQPVEAVLLRVGDGESTRIDLRAAPKP